MSLSLPHDLYDAVAQEAAKLPVDNKSAVIAAMIQEALDRREKATARPLSTSPRQRSA